MAAKAGNGKNGSKPAKAAKSAKAPRRHLTLPKLSPRSVRVAVAGAIGIALLAGLYAQQQRLYASPGCRRRVVRVRLVDPPAWMPRELAYVITSQIQTAGYDARGEHRSVFDRGIVRDVWAKAEANPWIARVDRVKRHPDGEVEVVAHYHRPRALARSCAKPQIQVLPVTIDGVVLPLIDATLLDQSDFKLIDNVATPPPEPGDKWDAPDLADGLKVLRLFWKKPYVKEITVIDLGSPRLRQHRDRPEISIIAQENGRRQTKIVFGRLPVGDDYVVSAERRMANLDAYFKTRGGRLSGRDEIVDVRLDGLYVTPYD